MLYDQARPLIGNGDLLFFRGRRLFSRLIQLTTRSVFSHVAVALWVQVDGVRELYVIEAMEGRGVRLFPLRRYIDAGAEVAWFEIADPSINRDKVAAWALGQDGQRYASWGQLLRSFGLMTKLVCDWLGVPTRIDPERFFCSAFATQALLAGGWTPDESIDPTLIPPGEAALFPCVRSRGRLTKGPAT